MPSIFGNIASIIISFGVGFLFYYVYFPSDKEGKRQQIEQTSSLLINLVIFIWIGKVILHLELLFKDPLAVLAYPSDSNAFYLGCLMLLIQIIYKVVRKQLQYDLLIASFVPIFLFTSFVYEFIEIIYFEDKYAWASLLLYTLLLVLYLLIPRNRLQNNSHLFLLLWVVGQMLLLYTMSFATIFHYTIKLPFLIISLILIISLHIYIKQRKVA